MRRRDYLIILGDHLYHGARNPLPKDYNPKEVIEILNSYSDRIMAVRGNCDCEVDQMVLNFPIMSTYSTILYESKRLFLTHGHIYNPDNMPKLRDKDLFIYGHTHIPKVDKVDNIYIINPGSISLPKEESTNSYGVLDGGVLSIKDLEGNIHMEINIEE